MNVALITSSFTPHVGGVEECVRNLASCLQASGHQPIVITNRWPLNLPEYECIDGIVAYRFSMRLPYGSLRNRIRFIQCSNRNRKFLSRLQNQYQFDAVNIHCIGPNGYWGRWLSQRYHLPLVLTTHGERTNDSSGFYKSKELQKMFNNLMRDADYITSVSQHTLVQALELAGIQATTKCVQVIPNGVVWEINLQQGDSSSDDYIFALGRLVPEKGFDTLIEAYASLPKSLSMELPQLWIGGEGAERSRLEELIVKYSLQKSVRLLGQLSRNEVSERMKECRFFVLPSRREAFGIVALEAMAAGKAIIATEVGGIPEIVRDSKTGILIPQENEEALSSALTQLIENRELCHELGSSGKEFVRKFAWDRVTQDYLTLYTRLLASAKK